MSLSFSFSFLEFRPGAKYRSTKSNDYMTHKITRLCLYKQRASTVQMVDVFLCQLARQYNIH